MVRAKAKGKHNCWAVGRKKLGRDVMQQTPAAADNVNMGSGRSRRRDILSLAMSNTRRRVATASTPGARDSKKKK